jgi:glycine cleavage system H protein
VAVPNDRRYSKEHEWAIDEGDGTIRIGITEFAEHELGDVIYVELPKVGTAVKQNAQMGEIESVKAVSDLFSPVTGEIVEINSAVKDKPELVNEAPYEAGWLVKVKATDTGELASLLDSGQYEELTS